MCAPVFTSGLASGGHVVEPGCASTFHRLVTWKGEFGGGCGQENVVSFTTLEGEKCPCPGMEEASGAAVTFRWGQDPQR